MTSPFAVPYTGPSSSESFTRRGELLTPGHNVDRIDVGAGLTAAAAAGYDDDKAQMVAEAALYRWKRGEEKSAEKLWLSEYSGDLTSFYMIIAAARAAAEPEGAS